jgi:hypothetical protein
MKSARNTNVNDVLSALLARMDKTDAALASLISTNNGATKPAAEKPAAKVMPAVRTKPSFEIKSYDSKNGPAIICHVNNRKWGLLLTAETWQAIKENAADIQKAIDRLPR